MSDNKEPLKRGPSRLQLFDSPIQSLRRVLSGVSLKRPTPMSISSTPPSPVTPPLVDVPSKRISDGSAQSSFLADVSRKASTPPLNGLKQSAAVRTSVRCGGASLRGTNHDVNEDSICIEANVVNGVSETGDESVGFVAVLDGHNGLLCSSFLQKALYNAIKKLFFESSPSNDWNYLAHSIFLLSFASVDDEFLQMASSQNDPSGACAVACLVKGSSVVIAHVGDCCALLIDRLSGQVTRLTKDHNFRNSQEVKRIKASGGKIERNRLDGRLEPLRAFGDLPLKKKRIGLTAFPEIQNVGITTNHCLLLCSDGVTAKFSDEAIAKIILDTLLETTSRQQEADPGRCATQILIQLSKTNSSYDDATALLLVFEDAV